ncbi:MAG TPA: phage holin family protein [Thermoleophilaceae bacterium]|nr:phage holin family protein [Thermoleophilaceae bacterium]
MPETTNQGSNQLGDQSVGDLVKQLSEQTATLVRQEMKLAQTELQEKGKKAGIGAGMFGAGGLVAFFGAATLIAAAVLALATAVDSWLAAVIVGVVLLLVAGVAALLGKKQIEQATPPAPEQAVESVQRDVDTVKRKARR